jgi:hypothetical protein
LTGVKTGIYLKNLQPATISPPNLNLKPTDDGGIGIVGSFSPMQITITTVNPIPIGGGIRIKFPKWNNLAPTSLMQSYVERFSSCTMTPDTDAEIMKNPDCFIEKSDLGDTFIMMDAFPNGFGAGKPFSFVIDSLKNPLSMSSVDLEIVTFTVAETTQSGEWDFGGIVDQGVLVL